MGRSDAATGRAEWVAGAASLGVAPGSASRSRLQPGPLALICGVAFLCFTASYTRLPVVPLYARSLGLGTAQIGAINAAFFLVAGLLSIPLGQMSDRLGRRRLATAGLLALSTSAGLLSQSTTFPQILSTYVLLGIGMAAFGPTMMSLVADVSSPGQLGRSYGWYTLALYGGMSIGPGLGGVLADGLGYVPVFLASSGVLLLVAGAGAILLPAESSIRGGPSIPESAPPRIRELLRNRPLLGCLAATLGACFGLGMFITFFPLHAANRGLDVGQIGLVFLVQGACNGLARIPAGALSDRVSDRRVLVLTGLVGFCLSMVLLGFASTASALAAGAAMLGLGMALALTSLAALVVEVTPRSARGLAMGAYNASIYLGLLLNSVLVGPIAELTGLTAGFLLAALISGVTGGVFLCWVDRPEAAHRGA